MNTGTTKSPGAHPRSSSSAEPAFLPGETGRELDAGRMLAGAELAAAEERRLGRPLTFAEEWRAVLPAYR